jgi:hypothetical protein
MITDLSNIKNIYLVANNGDTYDDHYECMIVRSSTIDEAIALTNEHAGHKEGDDDCTWSDSVIVSILGICSGDQIDEVITASFESSNG